MEIIAAKSAGFCYGVNCAVEIAFKAAQDHRPVYCLGKLIHNNNVIGKLEADGIIMVKSLDDIPDGEQVIIRAHGAPASVYEKLGKKGCLVIDATCPFVKRIHEIVKRKSEEDRRIIIIGDEKHPEVGGIAGYCKEYFVISKPEDVNKLLKNEAVCPDSPLCVVVQTTSNRSNWEFCVNELKKHYTNCEIFDTICNATNERQNEAIAMTGQCDAMIVIGGKDSSNTAKLVDLCRARCAKVLWIEDPCELDLKLLKGCKKVGITAGASTPVWIIKEVYEIMDEEHKVTEGSESFAELLEDSIKTLHTGDKVTGTVTGVTPTEVQVDLKTKHAGYVPQDEFSDDPSIKLEEAVQVGSDIDVIVIKVNDVEGTVMLSKKKLDAYKGWEKVESAVESRETLEGTVTEENKGGIVVSVNGVRVFVPASQSGLPKDTPMSGLVRTHVKLKITEYNRARRRVIGSIRAVAAEERRAAADKIWNDIKVGTQYDGTVKSITSYGAFVDIGGIDGMVHITELGWSRYKHPSEVVSIGDKIHVTVIGIDQDKKKISLSCKDPEQNPWKTFIGSYSTGDVVDVKIVKLMPFGAFAELVPGVDGLIHISQITNRRIARPGEVLSEGQTVTVKITDIDYEKQKISLSMRAVDEGDAGDEPSESNAEENNSADDQAAQDKE